MMRNVCMYMLLVRVVESSWSWVSVGGFGSDSEESLSLAGWLVAVRLRQASSRRGVSQAIMRLPDQRCSKCL